MRGFKSLAALNIEQPMGSTVPQGAQADASAINIITMDMPPQSSHQAPPPSQASHQATPPPQASQSFVSNFLHSFMD
jgi:hypothetical protein